MTGEKWKAIQNFWSRFGLVAYDQYTVDPKAIMPYITYSAAVADFDNTCALTASLWYRGIGWRDVSNKADEIADYIGEGGVLEPYNGGAMWVTMGRTIFAQRLSDPDDDSIRRILINVNAEFLS